MKYEVLVESYHSLIEEEIDISINSTRLKCFMPYGTDFWVVEGKKYYSKIESIIFDKLIIKEIYESIKEIQYSKSSFSHRVHGIMDIDKAVIHSSIDVYLDMAYLYDYAYLDGKFIEIVIDRFDIEFI